MTGTELRERRKALHLTLAQLAELMHTTAATLSRWENGNRQMPPMAVALFERIERERKEQAVSEYYSVDSEKLSAITASVQQRIPRMTESHVREYCLADWPEGQEHQAWLDSASVAEIADWVLAGQ